MSKYNYFYIQFDENWFKKGDVLQGKDGIRCKVIKVYKITWWKKLLIKLNIRKRFKNNEVKVKPI